MQNLSALLYNRFCKKNKPLLKFKHIITKTSFLSFLPKKAHKILEISPSFLSLNDELELIVEDF